MVVDNSWWGLYLTNPLSKSFGFTSSVCRFTRSCLVPLCSLPKPLHVTHASDSSSDESSSSVSLSLMPQLFLKPKNDEAGDGEAVTRSSSSNSKWLPSSVEFKEAHQNYITDMRGESHFWNWCGGGHVSFEKFLFVWNKSTIDVSNFISLRYTLIACCSTVKCVQFVSWQNGFNDSLNGTP